MRKRKILGTAIAIALAAVVTFNLNFNSEVSKFSALNMANIEALADGEGGGTSCSSDWVGAFCGTPFQLTGTL